MIRITQLKLSIEHKDEDIIKKVAKTLRINPSEIVSASIAKKSIDARKKPEIFMIYTIDVLVKNEKKINKRIFNNNIFLHEKTKYTFTPTGTNKLNHRPVIIGMGPAGLFAAYKLAEYGYKPILLERGKAICERKKDVEKYWSTGVLNTKSNVQFGEGGAGTFSDGKLNTVVKDKDGKNTHVLETFCRFGASEEILISNKPHIGTDVLEDVITNMRNEIIRLGGEVRFENQVIDFVIEDSNLKSVVVKKENPDGSTMNEVIDTDIAVLSIGHSARDTFEMLYEKGFNMEAKNFAVGLRVEHPQEMIDKDMYGVSADTYDRLVPSSYKLTGHSANGRNVFSFCMCPGGYVVNASSEEGRIAVNGMSYSKRDGKNANSAIIVSVTRDDYDSDDALSGMRFQRKLEEAAFREGNGNIPVQLFGDFKLNQQSKAIGKITPCIKGRYTLGNLRNIFPKDIADAFAECMDGFEKSIKGYSDNDTVLSGVESRTSSPVRINRDEVFESNIKGVYPCGEGAGYAGGITSAAMDGIRVFEAIANRFSCK